MDERQAITRLRQGDLAGLEVLVRKYQVQAVRLADLITRDQALAEDIVQAAFLRAYERIAQFDPQRSFGPWFLRSVVNDALKAAARSQRLVPLEAVEAAGAPSLADLLADELPGPEQQLEAEELRQAVWAAMGKLPAEQRAAVVQRYFLDTPAEAPQSAWPNTARWRLHAGLSRLRRLLEPFRTGAANGRTRAQDGRWDHERTEDRDSARSA
ncbi:MAG: sigma-70 family RNA polymerase sigma factor [Anaerolineales bacterium]|nr:sigma-70 family RNA polymerase sigma factor [Anaerolineales bacterium]